MLGTQRPGCRDPTGRERGCTVVLSGWNPGTPGHVPVLGAGGLSSIGADPVYPLGGMRGNTDTCGRGGLFALIHLAFMRRYAAIEDYGCRPETGLERVLGYITRRTKPNTGRCRPDQLENLTRHGLEGRADTPWGRTRISSADQHVSARMHSHARCCIPMHASASGGGTSRSSPRGMRRQSPNTASRAQWIRLLPARDAGSAGWRGSCSAQPKKRLSTTWVSLPEGSTPRQPESLLSNVSTPRK